MLMHSLFVVSGLVSRFTAIFSRLIAIVTGSIQTSALYYRKFLRTIYTNKEGLPLTVVSGVKGPPQ